jgi:predicted nucleic acid-binding protein
MSKIRIVLDSNVILSAALFKQSTPRKALDKAAGTGSVK